MQHLQKYSLFLLFIVLFAGCSQKNSIEQQNMLLKTYGDKLLILNTTSLDNKQNIEPSQILKELQTQLEESNHTLFTKSVEITQHTITINYEKSFITRAQYSFDFEIRNYIKATGIYFYNFVQTLHTNDKELLKLIQKDFEHLYQRLDKIYVEKKRVYIYINDVPTLLTKAMILKRFNDFFKPYMDNKYEHIYLIPFDNRLIPTYLGFVTSKEVHLRSYIPYKLNTKSGSTLSSYKLHLFKQHLQSLIQD